MIEQSASSSISGDGIRRWWDRCKNLLTSYLYFSLIESKNRACPPLKQQQITDICKPIWTGNKLFYTLDFNTEKQLKTKTY